jgi:hypothetical protein
MSSPRLTVKSIADILRAPASNPSKVLHDQKYPDEDPQKFRTPYYQGVIAGIRRYYANSNNRSVLTVLRNKLLTIANKARRDNNLRVLDSFLASKHAQRRFVLAPNRRYSATVGGVEISLSADMQAMEAGVLKVIYFNCRATAVDQETASLIVELAHWVLQENGVQVTPRQIEVMDISNGRSLGTSSQRQSTMTALAGRAAAILSLWDKL